MKKWLWLIILVVGLAIVIAWRLQQKASTNAALNSQAAQRKSSSNNVVVATATSGDILQHLEAVGSITTPFDIKLGSKVAGIVDMLNVRPGDSVKSGEVLVRINPMEQEAQVAQDRSTLAQAQHQYTQALINETPADTNVQTTIRQNEATLASAEANEGQVTQNSAAQIQAAQASVTDASSKVASAVSQQGAASQAVLSAQANQKDATAKYTREYNLYKQGFVAAQDVDDAEAAKGVQDAAVNSAKQSLQAAQSAVGSAKAELDSSEQNLSIVKKQQSANIVASKATTHGAKEALTYAKSNAAAVPAYKQNLEALKSVVAADQAQLDNAIAQVGDTILKTSFDGTVTSRLIDPGSMATAGQELLEVQFLDWLYVTCSAPVDYVASVKVGQTASLTFDSLPDQTFTAPVVLVTPAADPTIRQFIFEVRLDNKSKLFKPGMFGHVDIVTGRSSVGVLVPREAVTHGQTGDTVTIIQDLTTDSKHVTRATAKVVPVETGASDAKNIEIKSGINVGDRVIVISYRSIKDGTKVTINTNTSGNSGSPSTTGSAAPGRSRTHGGAKAAKTAGN
jgi:RND family efflux transporter MFP subunit